MAIRSFQTNFHAGELDEGATSREDLQAYKNGATKLRNVHRLNQGGATRRGGWRFHAQVISNQPIDQPLYGRCIPFIFSEGQAYVVVMLDGGVARIFRLHDDDTVQPSQDLSGGPWSQNDLAVLDWYHYANLLWITGRLWEVQEIRRVGLDAFEIQPFAYEETSANSGITYEPFLKHARPEITLNPSGTTGDITLAVSDDHWTAQHVGVKVRHKQKQMVISAVTDAKNANATVLETLTDATETTDWDEQVWSAVWGYPATVTQHEERTWLMGGTFAAGSKIGAFVNFDVGTGEDADSVQFEVAGDRPPEILHAVSTSPHLQIFTNEGEHYIRTSTLNPTITPSNRTRLKASTYGTIIEARPVIYDEATFFLQRHGSSIRRFSWREVHEKYQSDDMSMLSKHLVAGTREMHAYFGNAAFPETNIDLVHEDGTWAEYHGIQAQNVSGMSSNDSQGLMRSMCVIEERKFALFDRIVGGRRELWLEEQSPDNLTDGGKTLFAEVPISIITGLEHLNGHTARVTDGRIDYGDFEVNGGQVNISPYEIKAGTYVETGLPFTMEVEPLPPADEIEGQSVHGAFKRIINVIVDIFGAITLNVVSQKGRSVSTMRTQAYTDDIDEPPEYKDGRYRFETRGWSRNPTVPIVHDLALPLTIRGITVNWTMRS